MAGNVFGAFENDDVPPSGLAKTRHLEHARDQLGAVDDLIDEDPVTDKETGLHGGRGDLVCLEKVLVDKENDDDRGKNGIEPVDDGVSSLLPLFSSQPTLLPPGEDLFGMLLYRNFPGFPR